MTPLMLQCPVCASDMDWHKGYGGQIRCCSKRCHDEAEWRIALSILGKMYYPDPRIKQKGNS